jgi:hypothetical protein
MCFVFVLLTTVVMKRRTIILLVTWYVCGTLSLIPRENFSHRVFGNMVRRKILDVRG